jgi:hypothetical protein
VINRAQDSLPEPNFSDESKDGKSGSALQSGWRKRCEPRTRLRKLNSAPDCSDNGEHQRFGKIGLPFATRYVNNRLHFAACSKNENLQKTARAPERRPPRRRVFPLGGQFAPVMISVMAKLTRREVGVFRYWTATLTGTWRSENTSLALAWAKGAVHDGGGLLQPCYSCGGNLLSDSQHQPGRSGGGIIFASAVN